VSHHYRHNPARPVLPVAFVLVSLSAIAQPVITENIPSRDQGDLPNPFSAQAPVLIAVILKSR
jgi:hypothetical protein